MSDDLKKLAAELRDITPSKVSRKTGMDAAMAAFDAEFAAEAETVSAATNEKISTPAQGSAAAPRPTGHRLHANRVQNFGSQMMTAFNKIFNITPRTAMMGSSCMAAMIMSFAYFQGGVFDGEPLVTDEPNTVVIAETDPTPSAPVVDVPVVEVPVVETPVVATPPKTAEGVTDPKPVTVEAPKIETPSNTVVIERRVLKRPAMTQERVVPSIAKTETRRRVKTPATTTERVIPAITKEVTRSVKKEDGTFETVTETLVVQPQSVEYTTVPAEYETYTESVVVQEASTELVTVPAQYETVRETIELQADGSTRVVASETVSPPKGVESQGGITSVSDLLSKVRSSSANSPAENQAREARFRARAKEQSSLIGRNDAVLEYRAALQQKDNIELFVAQQGANTSSASDDQIVVTGSRNERAVSAVTKQVARRVIKTPASTQERVIPAITKDVTFRIQKDDGTFEDVTKTIVIQEASTELVTAPPVYETVMETVVVQPGWQAPYTGPASRDQFENYESNPVTPVEETPVSTFSIDVDTASYSFLRASLNRGQLPPPGAIRLEEMINYFPYDYDAPTSADEPFKANVTVTSTPWNPETKLMHIGIKGYVPPANEKPRSNIVFLIDTSGSMNQTNKLPLLINSFKLLVNTLDEDDTVSIVTYAGRAGTVLEPTPASDKNAINEALTRLRAGGSTAGAAGLELAYQKAQESFDEDGVNRVILATDGDFNVGFSSHQEMKTFITKKRETGIFLSVLGFGSGNYNDQLMQSLAQNGNGVAAYIDTLSEANKVLANEAGSALYTIAKDVKIQVEFNPETISEYRLIGYETRALKREDFNNDKVDAGEIGAGHTVTAIYEMTPVNSASKVFDPLQYVDNKLTGKTTGSDEFAYVKIRHKLPKSDTSTLQTFPIGPRQVQNLTKASNDMIFAAAVAAVGQKLRGDPQLADYSYDDAIKMASGAKGDDENGYRSEFIQLVRLAENLQD